MADWSLPREDLSGRGREGFRPPPLERARGRLEAFGRLLRRFADLQFGSIWRDLAVKKRKTEVDMQTAVIVETGRAQGIPTPVNAAVLAVIHEIEDGKRGMEWSNLQEIATRGGLSAGT